MAHSRSRCFATPSLTRAFLVLAVGILASCSTSLSDPLPTLSSEEGSKLQSSASLLSFEVRCPEVAGMLDGEHRRWARLADDHFLDDYRVDELARLAYESQTERWLAATEELEQLLQISGKRVQQPRNLEIGGCLLDEELLAKLAQEPEIDVLRGRARLLLEPQRTLSERLSMP